MTSPRLLLAAALALSLASCRAGEEASTEPRTGAAAQSLAGYMTGAFSSSEQAAIDPDNFYAVRLTMVPIWSSRADGPWLYVEQAIEDSLDAPYRQRVYHLVETSNGVSSEVYTLPGDPMEVAGAWAEPERFDAWSPDDLTERDGCAIHLVPAGDVWVGSTNERDCASTLRGATYATSEVSISDGTVTSWDRGFDANGEQVWGATEGAYVFERMD